MKTKIILTRIELEEILKAKFGDATITFNLGIKYNDTGDPRDPPDPRLYLKGVTITKT